MLVNSKGLVARPSPASAAATPVPAVRPFQILFPPAPVHKASSNSTVVARHSNHSTEVSTPVGATAVLDEAILQDELTASAACGTDGTILMRQRPDNIAPNGKRYHIHTFGCQMNIADSERMAGCLEAVGYECCEDPSDADVLVYNTCSIREKAEVKVYSALGRQGRSREVRTGGPGWGPQYANRITELLDRADDGQLVATDPAEVLEDITVPKRESDISAWVNVIYGCNEKCSYCVVPYTRGLEQSRKAEDIKREMTVLGEAGYKELPKLCAFFHIPFQSGDNDILREMKRGYTHERYRAIIDNIRRYMPDASISGDAIVGFPGETEEQYLRTEALVREVGFDRVNTAAYSPRPNTPAAVWDNQVADLIKADRLNRLNRVVMEVAGERSQRFLNRTFEVLVEGVNPKNSEQAFGRIRQNKLAYFDGDGVALRGKLVHVHIHECRAFSLFGRIVEDPSAQDVFDARDAHPDSALAAV
ncbi:hypothetical protein DUNSADRAFT_819 [Dunaliella salina]|uniref:Uncharacterized protein n=2 Tax=Dunaliella salina TaxID=3046 RepID=A0ABQ7GXT0_DUNSA|nr:hypothetical protein DUNSADRAFT_819 [Dunaliella salina]|eukprot:KAF5839417.1 hypothetical protein DUNSADRAFT_819 [Dunaliella salina]